jgi:hypothetical protein
VSADLGTTQLDTGRTAGLSWSLLWAPSWALSWALSWAMAAKLGRALAPFLATAAMILCGTLILSWVALFNGAPLVFADTAAYATDALAHEISGLFSVFYTYLILPLHRGVSLWPVVLAQAAIVTHLLYLTARCVSGGAIGRLATLAIVAALSIVSSLPWVAGEVMPDVFSPVLMLGVFLLAFCLRELAVWELLYVAILTAVAITAHFSHVPIAAGLILLGLCMRFVFVRDRLPFGWLSALVIAPFIVAVSCMVTVNWVDTGKLGLARNTNVFFLAKWIGEGPALRYLQESCPDTGYELCAHLAALPGLTQDDLKWAPDSPFAKVGSFDELEPEARRIVSATLTAYPLDIVEGALLDTGRQLLHGATGDGLSADFAAIVAEAVRPVFADGADVADSLLQSRQGKGELPLQQFRLLHRGFLGIALAFVAWALFARGRRLPGKLVLFAAFVATGLLVNAAVTGGLSGPYDRYFARVVWLVGFVALLTLRYVAKADDVAKVADKTDDRGAAIQPA